MGWSWSLFGVVIVERLELGGEKGQNRHTYTRVAVAEITP